MPMKLTHRVRFYQDKKGEFRWRMIAKNGRIVCESGEGYKTMNGAVSGFRWVVRAISEVTYEASQLEGAK